MESKPPFFVLVTTLLFLVHSADPRELIVVAVGDGAQKRMTPLNVPLMTETSDSSLVDLDLLSSDTPQLQRRLVMIGIDFEGNLRGSDYVISNKNGSFQNFTLPCPSHELYSPIGLESRVVQLITCVDRGNTFAVEMTENGKFTVTERTASQFGPSSSAAILNRNGQSTAIYVSSGTNTLLYQSLAVGGVELPFFQTTLDSCSDWKVRSYSTSDKVALFCASSNKLFLATGGDGGVEEVKGGGLTDPSSLTIVRDRGVAIEIIETGVTVHWNDFADFSPITTPSKVDRVDYNFVDDNLYIFLCSSSNDNSIRLLNFSALLLTQEPLTTIVDESSPIDCNTTYVYTSSGFSSLAYVTVGDSSWTVKTIDFITLHQFPPVHQPWSPTMIDLYAGSNMAATKTSTESESVTESMSSSSLISTSATTVQTMGSTTVLSTSSSTSISSSHMRLPGPSSKAGDNESTKTLEIIVPLVVFLFVTVLCVLFVIFLVLGLHTTGKLSFSQLSLSRRPNNTDSPLSTSTISMPVMVADHAEQEVGTGEQETGMGGEGPAFNR